jgi:hypothetical protein
MEIFLIAEMEWSSQNYKRGNLVRITGKRVEV